MPGSTYTVPGRFAGKIVIVTGAGSGIGRSTALRLAREGATVIAADISGPRLQELTAENPSLPLVPVTADLTKEQDVWNVVKAAGGRVDGLVNNAGVADAALPAAEVDDETWDRVFAINVTAAMRLTRAVLPHMLQAGAGAIVNVSSIASLRGSAAGAAYTASKHALNGLTKSIAVFYSAKGIRANVVAPGRVATNIDATYRSELATEVLKPLVRACAPNWADPDEIAATITFLLSDDAGNVNGAVLACDGGWSARSPRPGLRDDDRSSGQPP